MFNGYHETPATAYNELELERCKKNQVPSKWPCANGTGSVQSNHIHPQSHQPEIWTAKSHFIGLPNSVNVPPKCNCPSCYQSAESQSYQGDISWNKSWLSRTFPVTLNASQDQAKLQANHHWPSPSTSGESTTYANPSGVQYIQETGEKSLLYKSYANLRHPDLCQAGIVSALKNVKAPRPKDDVPKQGDDMSPCANGTDMMHQGVSVGRFPSAVPGPAHESFRGAIDGRRMDDGFGYCGQGDKFGHLESCRQQNNLGSYHLNPNLARRTVLDSYIKGVPSNPNHNIVPSVPHRSIKDNIIHSYVDHAVGDAGKVSASAVCSSISEEKHCRSFYPANVIKEVGGGQENAHSALVNPFPSQSIDYHGVGFGRDLPNPFADKDLQKYVNGRNCQYFPRSHYTDLTKRNGQSALLDSGMDYGANRKGVIASSDLNAARGVRVQQQKAADNALSPNYGKYNAKDCSVAAHKGPCADAKLLAANQSMTPSGEGLHRGDGIPRNESENPRNRVLRSHIESNVAFAGEKGYGYFHFQANIPPYEGYRRPEYQYPRRSAQGSYEYPNGMVNLSRNNMPVTIGHDSGTGYQHSDLVRNGLDSFSRVGSNFPYDGPGQQSGKFHYQASPCSTASPTTPHSGAQTHQNIHSEPDRDKQNVKAGQPPDKISHLESIRQEDLRKTCRNVTSKISPLRLLRKKKFLHPKSESAAEASAAADPAPDAKNATPPLDVRRFWATWAEEEDESVPQTQMVVLDCRNIDPEQAGLLHLYNETEPIRAVQLDGNILDVKAPFPKGTDERDVSASDRTFECENVTGGNGKTSSSLNPMEKPCKTNENRDFSIPRDDCKQSTSDLSYDCQAKVNSRNVSDIPVAVSYSTGSRTGPSAKDKSEVSSPKEEPFADALRNEGDAKGDAPGETEECNKSRGEPVRQFSVFGGCGEFAVQGSRTKVVAADKKRPTSDLATARELNSNMDRLKGDGPRAMEIAEGTGDGREVEERLNSPVGDGSDDANDVESSPRADSSDDSQSCDMPALSDLPTSEYRKNKFLDYVEDGAGGVAPFASFAKGFVISCPSDKASKLSASNNTATALSDAGLRNDEGLDEEFAGSDSSGSGTNLKTSSSDAKTGHQPEMDELLKKLSGINFQSATGRERQCYSLTDSNKTDKSKQDLDCKKEKKSRKLSHKSSRTDQLAAKDVSAAKPTVEFSIQKSHDLKISLKILNARKKCDGLFAEEPIAMGDSSRGEQGRGISGGDRQEPIALESVEDAAANGKADDDAPQKKSKKKKKFRPERCASPKAPVLKIKKSRYMVTDEEETDPARRWDSREKDRNGNTPHGDFRVLETVDSAKIKLTFKRNKSVIDSMKKAEESIDCAGTTTDDSPCNTTSSSCLIPYPGPQENETDFGNGDASSEETGIHAEREANPSDGQPFLFVSADSRDVVLPNLLEECPSEDRIGSGPDDDCSWKESDEHVPGGGIHDAAISPIDTSDRESVVRDWNSTVRGSADVEDSTPRSPSHRRSSHSPREVCTMPEETSGSVKDCRDAEDVLGDDDDNNAGPDESLLSVSPHAGVGRSREGTEDLGDAVSENEDGDYRRPGRGATGDAEDEEGKSAGRNENGQLEIREPRKEKETLTADDGNGEEPRPAASTSGGMDENEYEEERRESIRRSAVDPGFSDGSSNSTGERSSSSSDSRPGSTEGIRREPNEKERHEDFGEAGNLCLDVNDTIRDAYQGENGTVEESKWNWGSEKEVTEKGSVLNCNGKRAESKGERFDGPETNAKEHLISDDETDEFKGVDATGADNNECTKSADEDVATMEKEADGDGESQSEMERSGSINGRDETGREGASEVAEEEDRSEGKTTEAVSQINVADFLSFGSSRSFGSDHERNEKGDSEKGEEADGIEELVDAGNRNRFDPERNDNGINLNVTGEESNVNSKEQSAAEKETEELHSSSHGSVDGNVEGIAEVEPDGDPNSNYTIEDGSVCIVPGRDEMENVVECTTVTSTVPAATADSTPTEDKGSEPRVEVSEDRVRGVSGDSGSVSDGNDTAESDMELVSQNGDTSVEADDQSTNDVNCDRSSAVDVTQMGNVAEDNNNDVGLKSLQVDNVNRGIRRRCSCEGRLGWSTGSKSKIYISSLRHRSKSLNIQVVALGACDQDVQHSTLDSDAKEEPQLDIPVWDIPLPPGEAPPENCLNMEQYLRKILAEGQEVPSGGSKCNGEQESAKSSVDVAITEKVERPPEIGPTEEMNYPPALSENLKVCKIFPACDDEERPKRWKSHTDELKSNEEGSTSNVSKSPFQEQQTTAAAIAIGEQSEDPGNSCPSAGAPSEEASDEKSNADDTLEETHSILKSSSEEQDENDSGKNEETVDRGHECATVDSATEVRDGTDSSLNMDDICEQITFTAEKTNQVNSEMVDDDVPDLGETEVGLEKALYRTDNAYECDDLVLDESLTTVDDMEEARVSDDDKFRNIMQNCLENAKKFLSEGNLKLFSCPADDFLGVDRRFAETCVVEEEAEKPDNHVSKDVLLTSCEETVSEDLVLADVDQPAEISVDFVPSFFPDNSVNLCPEILPVDNWPYLEEEVPSSPPPKEADDGDLMDSFLDSDSTTGTAASACAPSQDKKRHLLRGTNDDRRINRRLLKGASRRVSLSATESADIIDGRRRQQIKDRMSVLGPSNAIVRRRRTIEGISEGQKMGWKESENLKSATERSKRYKSDVGRLLARNETVASLADVGSGARFSKGAKHMNRKHTDRLEDNQNPGSRREMSGDPMRGRCEKVGFVDEECGRDKKIIIKNGSEYKSSLWQPKVVLFRISKDAVKDVSLHHRRGHDGNDSSFADHGAARGTQNPLSDDRSEEDNLDEDATSRKSSGTAHGNQPSTPSVYGDDSRGGTKRSDAITEAGVAPAGCGTFPGNNAANHCTGRKRKKSRFRNLHTKKRIVPELTKDNGTDCHRSTGCGIYGDSDSDSESTSPEREIPKEIVCSQSKSTKTGLLPEMGESLTRAHQERSNADDSRTWRNHLKSHPGKGDPLKVEHGARERSSSGGGSSKSDRHRKENKRKRDECEPEASGKRNRNQFTDNSERRRDSDGTVARGDTRKHLVDGRKPSSSGDGRREGGGGDDERSRKVDCHRDGGSRHRRDGDKSRHWVCEVCGFTKSSERIEHIQSHPFHCQSCYLAFKTEANFVEHLTRKHKDIKNQHHCLLCEMSFDVEKEYQRHLETREHRHLEAVEKNTINTLFVLLTGHPCPVLGPVETKPEWLPTQAGTVHFYHQATPLSLALQYLKLNHDKKSYTTSASSPRQE